MRAKRGEILEIENSEILGNSEIFIIHHTQNSRDADARPTFKSEPPKIRYGAHDQNCADPIVKEL